MNAREDGGAGGGESRALVIIPTYDEAGTIAEALGRLFEASDDVDALVVDDGSPDGTADLVRTEAALRPGRIHLLERPVKSGLGSAYVEGFRWGLQKDYEAFVEMDADLSHDPAAVPSLLEALAAADLAIGSRYVEGGRVRNWGALRRGLSRGGNFYTRLMLGLPVRDATAGFRAYRAGWLARQDLASVASEGYAFQIEMTRRVHRDGGRIVEVPITFTERVAGRSKMSMRIVVEALRRVTRWGLADRFGRWRRHGKAETS